jgi:Tfp pilus assembly protein PilX
MKTGKTRQNGFVLIFVIVVLALIGMYMMVLTGDSNTIIFQTNRVYLEACEQNLAASGLIWAKKNTDNTKPATGVFELDAAAMNIRGAVLNVTVSPGTKGVSQVQVSTSCSRARQTVTSSREFNIETQP